jgi:hypothetical protein
MFYIIGTDESSCVETRRHEYCHGLYYLNPEYKDACDKIYYNMTTESKEVMFDGFKEMGYAVSKYADEVQAYLTTSTVADLLENFKFTQGTFPLNTIRDYQENFSKYPQVF